MSTIKTHIQLDQPAAYQIQVQGRLDDSWSAWFDGFAITVACEGEGVTTTLIGTVADQAALYSLLSRIRDLGLPLLLVQCVEQDKS